MISIAAARKIIESKDRISISFWKKNGEIRHVEECECTSSFFEKNTFNIILFPSEDIITIRAYLIFCVNDLEVAL